MTSAIVVGTETLFFSAFQRHTFKINSKTVSVLLNMVHACSSLTSWQTSRLLGNDRERRFPWESLHPSDRLSGVEERAGVKLRFFTNEPAEEHHTTIRSTWLGLKLHSSLLVWLTTWCYMFNNYDTGSLSTTSKSHRNILSFWNFNSVEDYPKSTSIPSLFTTWPLTQNSTKLLFSTFKGVYSCIVFRLVNTHTVLH